MISARIAVSEKDGKSVFAQLIRCLPPRPLMHIVRLDNINPNTDVEYMKMVMCANVRVIII